MRPATAAAAADALRSGFASGATLRVSAQRYPASVLLTSTTWRMIFMRRDSRSGTCKSSRRSATRPLSRSSMSAITESGSRSTMPASTPTSRGQERSSDCRQLRPIRDSFSDRSIFWLQLQLSRIDGVIPAPPLLVPVPVQLHLEPRTGLRLQRRPGERAV